MDIVDIVLKILSSSGTIVALVALVYQIITERGEKLREQANDVSTWVDKDYIIARHEEGVTAVIICNHSKYPIYEVAFSVDDMNCSGNAVGRGSENCSIINILPPGVYASDIDFGGGGMCHKFNSSITFRDHSGRYWTRNANGLLIREKGENVIYNKRKLSQPYSDAIYSRIGD